jgi:hypothetical protein
MLASVLTLLRPLKQGAVTNPGAIQRLSKSQASLEGGSIGGWPTSPDIAQSNELIETDPSLAQLRPRGANSMSPGKDKRRAELEQLRWQGAESGSCIPKCGNSVDRIGAALNGGEPRKSTAATPRGK